VLKRRKTRALKRKIAVIATVALIITGAVLAYQFGGKTSPSTSSKVLLVTSMGNITIQLYEDMPITTGNFKKLVSQKAYDGTKFHRVAHNFVIQGGEVPGAATIQDELPNKHSNIQWTVAMAKTSLPNSATSQFFINLKDNSATLDSNYSVFGIVVEGREVVEAIGNVETVPADDGEPVTPITIISARFVS